MSLQVASVKYINKLIKRRLTMPRNESRTLRRRPLRRRPLRRKPLRRKDTTAKDTTAKDTTAKDNTATDTTAKATTAKRTVRRSFRRHVLLLFRPGFLLQFFNLTWSHATLINRVDIIDFGSCNRVMILWQLGHRCTGLLRCSYVTNSSATMWSIAGLRYFMLRSDAQKPLYFSYHSFGLKLRF